MLFFTAGNTSGNNTTDSIRSIELAKLVVKYALELLKPEGIKVRKIFRGNQDEHKFLKDLKL
jgi:23S rRNA U2552 (ribose-2'-O)-methylase RlmE/FtsJ